MRYLQRSLIAFLVNLAEVVLCFSVLFMAHNCGVNRPGSAIYNSLGTAVTIGPTDVIRDCDGLVAAEVVVAYLVTVLVIAAVVGQLGRDTAPWLAFC
jgi:hypothetical protein